VNEIALTMASDRDVVLAKFDLGRMKVGDTGNLFLHRAERNPLKRF